MALNSDQITELIRSLPHSPGVYLMEDAKAKVIYVGKAKDLKKRVPSYFQKSRDHTPKIRALVGRVAKVGFLVVGSEKEALILEATLIKRHRPRYNVALRDDKRYPLIRVSQGLQWPNLAIVRQPARDGHRYFGPYASAGAARATMRLMGQLFPLRKCKGPQPPRRSRPCLHHQLGQCLGPCCLPVDPMEYNHWVEEAVAFLSGRLKEISTRLEKAMWRAAGGERYEEAAVLRDKLTALRRTLEKQVVVSSRGLDRDVFGYGAGPGGLAVAVLFVRSGSLVGSRSFFLKELKEADAGLTAQNISQFYTGKTALPDQIMIPGECQDRELLEEWLSEVKGAKVRIITPQRGQGVKLISMAQANASSALPLLAGSPEAVASQALEEIGRKLGLEGPPVSMECYDISIHQGQNPVGAMVRFEEGRPARSKYRNYKIRTVEGQDDFAMLAEVLSRRFKAPAGGGPSKVIEFPDLIVMDGGKGQLSAAKAVLDRVGLIEQPLAALAKTPGSPDEDRLFIPGRKNPVSLSRPARLLLMRLRDETHRRAITAHRRSGVKKLTKSALLSIVGVGPKRARELLKTLGSLQAVKSAGVGELSLVPGISPALAQKIHDHLHGKKNEPQSH